jgi:hypothetical protein
VRVAQEKADAILAEQGVERQPLSKSVAIKDDPHEPEELGLFSRHPHNDRSDLDRPTPRATRLRAVFHLQWLRD